MDDEIVEVRLEQIDLWGQAQRAVTDQDMAELAPYLAKLECPLHLTIQSDQITDDGVAALAQVRYLNILALWDVKATARGIGSLKDLTYLDIVMLGNCVRVADEELQELKHTLKRVQVMTVKESELLR